MIVKQDIFLLTAPYRDENTLIRPITPGLQPPPGCGRIPGYLEKIRAVRSGVLEPFWGHEYALHGEGPPADFVAASPILEAMSEALRQALTDCGVQGVRYYPIRVAGRYRMYLFGVEGKVGLDPTTLKLRLLDGAEIGVYDNARTCLSPRVAESIRAAKLDIGVEPIQIPFGFTGGSVEGP